MKCLAEHNYQFPSGSQDLFFSFSSFYINTGHMPFNNNDNESKSNNNPIFFKNEKLNGKRDVSCKMTFYE